MISGSARFTLTCWKSPCTDHWAALINEVQIRVTLCLWLFRQQANMPPSEWTHKHIHFLKSKRPTIPLKTAYCSLNPSRAPDLTFLDFIEHASGYCPLPFMTEDSRGFNEWLKDDALLLPHIIYPYTTILLFNSLNLCFWIRYNQCCICWGCLIVAILNGIDSKCWFNDCFLRASDLFIGSWNLLKQIHAQMHGQYMDKNIFTLPSATDNNKTTHPNGYQQLALHPWSTPDSNVLIDFQNRTGLTSI